MRSMAVFLTGEVVFYLRQKPQAFPFAPRLNRFWHGSKLHTSLYHKLGGGERENHSENSNTLKVCNFVFMYMIIEVPVSRAPW